MLKRAQSTIVIFAAVAVLIGSINISEVFAASNYVMTVSDSVSGGGNPTAPLLNYVSTSGQQRTYTLTTTSHAVTMKKGAAWSVTPGNTIAGSSVEQWYSSNTTWSGTTPGEGLGNQCLELHSSVESYF